MAKEESNFGVTDLAKRMKKSPAMVRLLLRKNKTKKSGKSYGWKNQAALVAEAKRLGGAGEVVRKKSSTKKSPAKKAA